MESLSMNGIGKTLSSRSGNPTEDFELSIILKLLFRQMLSSESQICMSFFGVFLLISQQSISQHIMKEFSIMSYELRNSQLLSHDFIPFYRSSYERRRLLLWWLWTIITISQPLFLLWLFRSYHNHSAFRKESKINGKLNLKPSFFQTSRKV